MSEREGSQRERAPTGAVLELADVTRVHGSGETAVYALRGVSLSVAAGELVAVMGPSGSGKSTLLTLAGGLDEPTAGRVLVEGRDLAELDRAATAALRRRSVGYVFQDFNGPARPGTPRSGWSRPRVPPATTAGRSRPVPMSPRSSRDPGRRRRRAPPWPGVGRW